MTPAFQSFNRFSANRLFGRFNLIALGLFILISMGQIWLTRYVPSLDGPQHLYNANVLVRLFTGNDFFGEYFRINPVVVGYWTGHFTLGFFKLFFPAWLAEKLFLTAYVLGMFFSFRYLIRSIQPEKSNLLVFLIFPFIFHNYLVLGYYAFSIAFIFLFLAFGYWIRKRERFGWKEMAVFGAIGMGIFLSHALVFLFFGVSFVFFFLVTTASAIISGKTSWSVIGSRVWRLTVALLPSLVIWANFLRVVMEVNPGVAPATYSNMELVGFIFRIRQLVGFHHEIETPAYIILFIMMVVISLYGICLYLVRLRRKEWRWTELPGDRFAWIGVSLICLGAYFLAPDRISAGSLTNRFGLFFFLSFLVFLASLPANRILQVITLLVTLGVMVSARKNHHHFLVTLNDDIRDVQTMVPYMEDGSTVVSLNASTNWVHLQFPLYVAVDKEFVHLNNPQCGGQFPLVWDASTLPVCKTGTVTFLPPNSPEVFDRDAEIEQVDYITIFHQQRFWSDKENEKWMKIINDHYEQVMVSPRNLNTLYKRKGL
jgi:hypothetical protein